MFKVLDEVCKPRRATKYSAYVDLFAREDITIGAGETVVIPLGVKLDIDWNNIFYYHTEVTTTLKEEFLKSHYLEIALRSSLAVKGLIIANGIGIIDLDYQDELGVIVHNPIKPNSLWLYKDGQIYTDLGGKTDFVIKKGDKVCQCTLKEHIGYLMGYESDVARDGGFGSTGK